jgi:hypothetical protein
MTKLTRRKAFTHSETPQTVRKLTKIPEKQKKDGFSPSVYTKNTKNSSF